MLFFAEQVAEAKAELLAMRQRHDRDSGLEQRINDLTELSGVCSDAFNRQRRSFSIDPMAVGSIEWTWWHSLAWGDR